MAPAPQNDGETALINGMTIDDIQRRLSMISTTSVDDGDLPMSDMQRRSSLEQSQLNFSEAKHIKVIEDATEDLINKLRHHRIYSLIKTPGDLKIFMSYHIYCVWDFMNLVKKLQLTFTSCEIPFRPAENGVQRQIRRFVNEVILEEESDEIEGSFISHFAYYFRAFNEIDEDNDDYQHVFDFYDKVAETKDSYEKLLELDSIPKVARTFMRSTMSQVQHKSPLVTAASFTFGREDLLPHIFKELISQPLLAQDRRLKKFEIYLDRHIELDGDCHSHLAKKMCAILANSDADWKLAKEASLKAIKSRLAYWDEVADKIEKHQPIEHALAG